ncbi:hypothetical protein OXPF_20880 [Oxobacter pfennigii]|uniref:Uncharacterized protein n=1 Tax=Oxobacter pfennigii TaxID=36849 RepID=A0A0P8YW48_9CLOT|nr:DNA-processing protein DprA [Oxobacter pfennigii]KPU43923.1 hypothetical protein OXPF_20880 [Oxobacter pfennigii]
MDNLLYYYWITTIKGISTRKIYKLLEYYGDIKSLWNTIPGELKDIPGMPETLAYNIINRRNENTLLKEIKEIKSKGIDIITVDSENYPENLKNIYEPPIVLYIKGSFKECRAYLGVVGSRKCSSFGKTITRNMAKGLAEYGIGIISGMARGIDTQAHFGALDSDGYTCAVVGCGLDIVYPPENKLLMKEIINRGAVVSEYVPGTQPYAYNFPERNRIISGLSDALLVVEAGEKSGALITVDFAIEQGKDVFAVPGSILSSISKGTNKLIKDGAKIVTDIDDILEEFKIDIKYNNINEEKLSEAEKMILSEIENAPVQADKLLHKMKLKIGEFNSVLTSLELKGIVKVLPGKYVIRIF